MAILTAEQFMSEFELLGAGGVAKKYGLSERQIYKRRRELERLHDITIAAPTSCQVKHPGRVPLEIKNGTVLVGSDFHIWPEPAAGSTCLRAFKKLVADLKPDVVILNGDVLDFPRLSRFPQSWESAPDPQQEIEAAQDHLADIVAACKRGAQKIWTLGNHDARFESMFANQTPAMRGVKGVHLADHFSVWQKAMSCMINEGRAGPTMVKHRLKGGVNATRNNTLNAGISIVTGHLHSQNVRPLSDYNRHDRYGVDTGCVADKEHRAFTYTEDAPLDWRSGFALLTYRDYRLLFPELVTKWADDAVQFRGKLIKC